MRPVFNGSSKSFNDKSLNDALEVGPALQTKILSILICFRSWLIAICSNIKSAFVAINLYLFDQDVCRFLLRNSNGSLRHIKFNVFCRSDYCEHSILNVELSDLCQKSSDEGALAPVKLNL